MSDESTDDAQIHENNLGATQRFLWVDDLRPAPEGWDWAQNYSTAIRLLEQHNYHTVSLDHDLNSWHGAAATPGGEIACDRLHGSVERTGYHVALWMVEHSIFPQTVRVHTMNPVGGQNIMQLLQRYHPNGAGAVLRVSPY